MRQRSFDINQALEEALNAFWLNGYGATSIDDLCQRMDIGRSSLYHAFGSKERLLSDAIDLYTDRALARLVSHFSVDRPFKDNMRAILEAFADGAVSGNSRRGCFIGELIAEFPAGSPKESRILEKKTRILKGAIEDAARMAIANGELESSNDPAHLAHFLFATIQGLRLTGKVSPDPEVLECIIDRTLNAIE